MVTIYFGIIASFQPELTRFYFQQEFQVAKMEVLYLIAGYFGGVFSLT